MQQGEAEEGSGVEVGGEGKPELMGSLYVGPQHGHPPEQLTKPELEGETKEDAGVIREIEDVGYGGLGHEHNMVSPELDYQARRRGMADAELEGRDRERRAAEPETLRTTGSSMPRKELPANAQARTGSSSSEIYPQSPVLSGPVPDFTAMYPAASDPEALEEERKLETQSQRLREMREQLAREEEIWMMKLKKRGSESQP